VHKQGHENGEAEGRVGVVGGVCDEALRELVQRDGDAGLQPEGHESVCGDVVVVVVRRVVWLVEVDVGANIGVGYGGGVVGRRRGGGVVTAMVIRPGGCGGSSGSSWLKDDDGPEVLKALLRAEVRVSVA